MADNAELRIRIIEDAGGAPAQAGGGESTPQTPAGKGERAPQTQYSEEDLGLSWKKYRKGMKEPPVRAGAEAAEGGEAAGAAGAEAAGAGGLAAMAGPIAAVGGALLVADLAAKQIAQSLHNFGEAVKGAGDAISTLISGDNMGALSKTANAAADALGAIPIVGQIFQESIKVATKALDAMSQVAGSIIGRGQELAPYSGELAAAGARAEIKSMMADIREAQVLGPGMAQVTDIWTDIQMELREFLLPLKKFLIETFAQFLEWIKDMFEKHQTELIIARESLTALLRAMIDFITLKWPSAAKDLADLPGNIRRAMEDANKAAKVVDNPIFQEFMQLAVNPKLPQFGVPADGAAAAFGPALAIPALAS